MHSSILAWRTPSLTEKPGKAQSTGSQRVGQDWSDPVHINTRPFFLFFFACGTSALVRVECEGGADAWLAGTLVAQSVQGHRLPPRQELCPIRDFFLAACSWRSEGLFGPSLSIALPVQALRGIPWLGSYSADRWIRHLKGHPGWGSTL